MDNVVTDFAPAVVHAGFGTATATGFWVPGPFDSVLDQVWAGAPRRDVLGYDDPFPCDHTADDPPEPGEACYHQTFGALFYANEEPGAPPLGCSMTTALCGNARRDCYTITMRLLKRPDALRVFGVEGGGNPIAGCWPTTDMLVALGADSDEDGAFDSSDRCPGYDDDLDSDGDRVPNGCDGDASTAVNGQRCTGPMDCSSNHCVKGVCCDRTCNYPCEACAEEGAIGQCNLIAGRPEAPCPPPLNNGGVCTGEDPVICGNDADGDWVADEHDACPGFDDAADRDADGTPDGCDACPNDALGDRDGDSLCDSADTCPLDPHNDMDADGLCANEDRCPNDVHNDVDGDGICADLDICPVDVANDADGDGKCESVDNCPSVANPDQKDAEGDGIGDACQCTRSANPKGTCFTFTGFFSPVDNLPVVNDAKAGSAIPVKFGLGGDQGLNIFDPGYPASSNIACNAAGQDASPRVPLSANAFSYDRATGRYTYVWKTEKSWAGSCRLLVVKLIDGTEHKARFRFK